MNEDQFKNSRLILHLKYIVVIFILICSTVGGMALYNQEFAIKSLSAASLLTSIVLAVVAILITLWDVAGQKNNIVDVKKSIEELRSVSGEINELVAGIEVNNSDTMKLLSDYITHFQEKSELSFNKFTELTERIEKINITEDSKEEYQKIKNELETMNQLLKDEYMSINNNEITQKTNNIASLGDGISKATFNLDLKSRNKEQLEILRKALRSINTDEFKKSLESHNKNFSSKES